MCRLVVIFTLFLVSAVAALPSISEMLSFFNVIPLEVSNGTECIGVSVGTQVCNFNCTKVLLCRGDDADPVELETCRDSFACFEGQCVNGTSSCEQKEESILCTGRGLFPDPNDCTKYHTCKGAGKNSIASTCAQGWAFDPLTGVCSKQVTDSICYELPIVCNEIGDSNTFPGNPSIYYICVTDSDGEMYPALYRCKHGGIYNPNTFLCDDTVTTTNATGSPTSGSPTTSTPTQSTITPSTPTSSTPTVSTPTSSAPTSSTAAPPIDGTVCSTPLEIIADPENCYSYYQCSVIYLWTRVYCNTGYYFNKEKLTCVYGACPYTYSS